MQSVKLNVPFAEPNPPSLFYDYQNNKQIHHPPRAIQTKQGVINLPPHQNQRQEHNMGQIQPH